ncbi:MAG: DUF2752 domain-containing protein [Myxococcales bacterium]|nr:DUF2752 domain-containing protein [Myxococcales bacterium]
MSSTSSSPSPDRALRLAIAAIGVVLVAHGLALVDVSGLLDGVPGCVFRAVSGIPCPGCGMTHAFLLLSELRFADAFEAHAAAPALAAVMAWRALRPAPTHASSQLWIAAALIAVLAVWILRLAQLS